MSKKDKLDEGFLEDLGKNIAVYLAVSALKGKKPSKIKDPELKKLYSDLESNMKAAEKKAKDRVSKMDKEKRDKIMKIANSL
jgi:hypothetical protein